MRPTSTKRGSALAALALLGSGALVSAAGCKGTPDLRGLCDAVQRCIGGNDKDVDACVDQGDLALEEADIQDCRSEFVDYATCVTDSGACTETRTSTFCQADADCTKKGLVACKQNQCTTKTYGAPDEACGTKKAAYTKCTGGQGGLLR